MRTVFVLLLGALPAAAQNCTKCPGGSGMECCGKYNTCCKGDGWSCIAADETCCEGTACIKQTTYCCPKLDNPSCPNGECPARCCPRWTVCCSKGGRDGCCTPLEASFWLADTAASLTMKPAQHSFLSTEPEGKTVAAAADPTVFAMFLEAGAFTEPLKVLTINAVTGAQTSRVVKDYDTHGENTRLFEFNRATGRFVTFENDFSQDPVGPLGLLPMYMFSVSPADGAVTKVEVTLRSAEEYGWQYPTGYKYNSASRMMVLATGPAPSGEAPLPPGGYKFYAVDSHGVATELSSTPGPASASGLPADPLAGWMHALSPSGQVAYRVGEYNVSASVGFGLGSTNLSDAASSFSNRTLPATHAAYLSLDARPIKNGIGTKLYSMAPRVGQTAAIDLLEWDANSATPPRVVSPLGDAHQPALFGDVAATMREEAWAALTVQHPGVIVNGGWALSFVADVSGSADGSEPASDAAVLLPLKPRVGGGTCSLSGIGFPDA
eukprot:COSAG02_NODE_366_length_23740_cov_20.235904_18_plen_494_part_00